MELTKTQINNVISILKNADGEDLQFILTAVAMDEQLLKQLVATSNDFDLSNALEEKSILKDTAHKVWHDIFNNDTLIHNDFESYWNNFKIN